MHRTSLILLSLLYSIEASIFDNLNPSKTHPDEVQPRKMAVGECTLKEYPYVVSIIYDMHDYETYCSGILLQANWVLSSAGCAGGNVSDLQDRRTEITVVAGAAQTKQTQMFEPPSEEESVSEEPESTTLEGGEKPTEKPAEAAPPAGKKKRDSPDYEERAAKTLYPHPYLTKRNVDDPRFDLILIELDTAFTLKIAFPNIAPKDCKQAVAVGFDVPTESEDENAERRTFSGAGLKCFEVNFEPNCTELNEVEKQYIDYSLYCSKNEKGDTPCRGHFGGPVVCENTVIATLAATLNCTPVDDGETFYIRLDYFYDFINNHTGMRLSDSTNEQRSAKAAGGRVEFNFPAIFLYALLVSFIVI